MLKIMDKFVNGKIVKETVKAQVEDKAPLAEVSPGQDEAEVVEELAVRPYRKFLGVSEFDTEGNTKLHYILRNLNSDNKLQPEEVMDKLRKMDNQLGEGQLGQSKLTKIYNHLRLVKTMMQGLLGGL